MGSRYKRELMERYGINPDATDYDWEEPEREILALLIDDVGRQAEENCREIEANQGRIEENTRWITGRKKVLESQGRGKKSWYRRADFQLRILMLVVALLSLLVTVKSFGLI